MGDVAREVPKEPQKIAKSSTARYYCAGVEVDLSQAAVRRNGETVALRPKTYRVLVFLLERRNRMVTKEELIDGVWEGAAVSDDVIGVSIAELRKALGDDPKKPQIIKTYPRMGYGLVAPVKAIAEGAPHHARHLRLGLAAAAAVMLAAGGVLVWRHVAKPAAWPAGEVAWWMLDEARGRTAGDASGGRQDGAIDAEAAWVQGKRGSGLWLGGPESAVAGRGSDSMPAGDAPRTISAWVKLAQPRVDLTTVFDYGSEFRGLTAERCFLDILADGRARFGADIGGGWVTGAGRWNDDAWHFLAASYEGPGTDIARIFVDGKLDKQEKLKVRPATKRGGAWRIGQSLMGGSAFRGAIDDVRVYHRALSAAQVAALYRCSADLKDLASYYYLPVYYSGVAIDGPATLHNEGLDYSGIQLALPGGECALGSLRGADVGQDLRIAVDLLVPKGPAGTVCEAGPYFRSRRAAPDDGLIGGTSAGYWVQLFSNGLVRVKRLNPQAVVAFSPPDGRFDAGVFHHLEMEARGSTLDVWLDGKPVLERVAIPAAWEGPPAIGRNEGAAGIAFGDEMNRGQSGGQEAKNFQLTRLK
ncbi:MAG: LamG-like jellyroll fold domain-containing protein [Bryobacteraceae bacterium]|jgi:DNA-binding winged helix-turn-helix (wHTH) protein